MKAPASSCFRSSDIWTRKAPIDPPTDTTTAEKEGERSIQQENIRWKLGLVNNSRTIQGLIDLWRGRGFCGTSSGTVAVHCCAIKPLLRDMGVNVAEFFLFSHSSHYCHQKSPGCEEKPRRNFEHRFILLCELTA